MVTNVYNFDDASNKAKERSESTVFVKLKDGEMAKGMFAGDVLEKISHYLPSTRKTVDCTGEGCIHCEAGIRRDVKYYQNFITYNETSKKYDVKVFGLSSQAMTALKESLLTAETTRERAVINVKRVGEKLETTYIFQIIKTMEAPTDIKLHDIVKIVNGK